MKDFYIAALVLKDLLERHEITPLDKFKIIQAIEVLERISKNSVNHS